VEYIRQFQLHFVLLQLLTSEVGTIQGEVEQISLMKPKAQGPHDEGFLEYLEDIIGTDQYVEKIEEAYKQ
jgi:structural maintenance of chromosome 4